jgi:hypothetical protein
MRSSSTATGWVLAILVSSMRGLLGVGLMVASALAPSGPLHGKQDGPVALTVNRLVR